MQINIIVACARNRVIGVNGTLPWSIPRDFNYFLGKTKGKTSIMGRITAEEYPREADRPLILISPSLFDQGSDLPYTNIVSNYSDAIEFAQKQNLSEVWVCGGASIYKESLSTADKLYITQVELDVEGDTVFPEWRKEFDVLESREEDQDNGVRFAFEVWTKSQPRD